MWSLRAAAQPVIVNTFTAGAKQTLAKRLKKKPVFFDLLLSYLRRPLLPRDSDIDRRHHGGCSSSGKKQREELSDEAA